MSSSYSSLDWVLSHWAHFTVRRFICVCVYLCFYVSYCIVVVSMWARWVGPDGIEAWYFGTIFLQCFDTVGWVIWPVKPVPNMTYNVFGGTLSLTQSINQSIKCCECVAQHRSVNHLLWLCLFSLSLADLVLSRTPEPPSTVVCAVGPSRNQKQTKWSYTTDTQKVTKWRRSFVSNRFDIYNYHNHRGCTWRKKHSPPPKNLQPKMAAAFHSLITNAGLMAAGMSYSYSSQKQTTLLYLYIWRHWNGGQSRLNSCVSQFKTSN